MKRATFITWEQLKVGGVILVAIAILTVAVFKLGEAANLFSKRYKLVALLPSANGLRVGGSVTVAGQLAGTVSAIEFLPPDADTSRNLLVTVEIAQSLQPQVREDSRARIRTLGLLGDKIVEISLGSPAAPALEPGDTLVSTEPFEMQNMFKAGVETMQTVKELAASLKGTAARVDRIAKEVETGKGLVHALVYDEPEALNRLNAILARTQRLLARADVFIQNLAPGAADRLRLGWAELQARHPRLIACDISGYGSGGPAAGRRAYDLLIIDAFSSDAIPVHLLTREALALYLDALAPDGLLAFHVSNRYFELEPVLIKLADDAGAHGAAIDTQRIPNQLSAPSSWVFIARKEQTIRALENVKAVVEGAGATMADVVRVGVYLKDMGNFAEMNEIYATYFPDPKPARTTVPADFPRFPIEIDAIAVLPD